MSQYAEVAVPAAGALGLAPQPYKGGEQTNALQFRWFQWTNINFGAVQAFDNLPPAVAASILPRSPFKTMFFGGGNAGFVPSLERDLYFLLRAAHGKDSVATQTGVRFGNVYGERTLVAQTGVNVHTFVPDVERTRLPWLTAAKLLPNPDSTKRLDEIMRDVRLTGIVLNVPGMGIVTAMLSFAGIEARWASPGFAPTYDRELTCVVNTSQCFVSFPDFAHESTTTAVGTSTTIIDSTISTDFPRVNQLVGYSAKLTGGDYKGEVRRVTGYVPTTNTITVDAFGGAPGSGVTYELIPALPVIGTSLPLDNGVMPPTSPDIYITGKPTPHDLPLTNQRVQSARVAVLVDTETNYDLLTLAFRGDKGAGSWSEAPFRTDLHVRVVSPFMITGSVPYALEFMTVDSNGTLMIGDAIPLTPGRTIVLVCDLMFQETTSPEIQATGAADGTHSTTTLQDTGSSWTVNQFKDQYVYLLTGTGLNQGVKIASNTADTLTFVNALATAPANGTTFEIRKYPTRWLATAGAASTISHTWGGWENDEFVGWTVKIIAGTGAGQVRMISTCATSGGVLTVSENWSTTPDATSVFSLEAPPWMYRLQNAQAAQVWPVTTS